MVHPYCKVSSSEIVHLTSFISQAIVKRTPKILFNIFCIYRSSLISKYLLIYDLINSNFKLDRRHSIFVIFKIKLCRLSWICKLCAFAYWFYYMLFPGSLHGCISDIVSYCYDDEAKISEKSEFPPPPPLDWFLNTPLRMGHLIDSLELCPGII